MSENFTLSVSWKDSLNLFPQNTPTDFLVQLPKAIDLRENGWVCTLHQAFTKVSDLVSDTVISICCSLLEEQYHYGRYLPVLASYTLKNIRWWQTFNPQKLPRSTVSPSTNFIHFKVLTEDTQAELALEEIKLVLIFEKHGGETKGN